MKKEKALNLCFFSHSSQLAGAERRLINLTSELISDYGALCTVLIPNTGPLKEKLHSIGCTTLELPYYWWCIENENKLHTLPRRLKDSYFSIKKSAIIKRLKPDVIITNTLVIPWGAIFAYENAIPHLWMVNEFGKADQGFHFYFGYDGTIQFIKSYSDKIITCSHAVTSELFNSPEQVEVAYDSFSNLPQNITSIESINDVFSNDESFHLLMVGSILIGKGQLDAVNAVIELIKNRGEKIELVLIGYSNREYQNVIETHIIHEGVQDKIRILPFRDEIYPIMKSADLILLCSRKEAFGRVIAEGMLLNKPVIGTNSGGITELIQNGKTGFLYSHGNYFQLADQIQELIHNPELRILMANNGKTFAMDKFCKKEFSGKFNAAFIKLKGIKKDKSLSRKIEMTSLYQAVLEGFNVGFPDNVRSDILSEHLERNEQVIYNLETQLIEREQEILSFAMSKSWVITRPLRKLVRFIKGKVNLKK